MRDYVTLQRYLIEYGFWTGIGTAPATGVRRPGERGDHMTWPGQGRRRVLMEISSFRRGASGSIRPSAAS